MATATAKGRRSKLHEEHEEHVNHERWLITYADMITLLMVLFIVLYSISQVDLAKFRRLKEGIAGGFGGPAAAGALSGGAGPLEGGGGVFDTGLPIARLTPEQALAATRARTAGAYRQRSVLQGAQREIQRTLDEDGLGDTVRFRLEARGLVVTIVSDMVLFEPGQADLRPEGREVVDKLAGAVGRLPNRLSVEGHTDNVPISGRFPSNWELSTARATTVLRELIDRHHVDPARLAAAGYADERPVAGNDTPEGRGANRRVELVVLADVAAALEDIANGGDPPVGEIAIDVTPGPTDGAPTTHTTEGH